MDADTVNRELSIARKAIGWWQRQGWVTVDPTVGIERRPVPPDRTKALAEKQIAALWRMDVALREKTQWKPEARCSSPTEKPRLERRHSPSCTSRREAGLRQRRSATCAAGRNNASWPPSRHWRHQRSTDRSEARSVAAISRFFPPASK